MQVKSGLVSVVIPTYNRALTVCVAIESVLRQTYPQIEILVVDDGSTDDTYRILKTYQQDRKIIYLTQANSGPAAARNRAVKMAHGEFIAFLDADDRWLPEKLAKQIPLFVRPEVSLVYSDMQFVGDRNDSFFALRGRTAPRGRVLSELIRENFIPTSTVVVRSSLLELTGLLFDDRERVPIGEDYYLWLKIAAVSGVDLVEEKLVEYSVHSGQISKSPARSAASLAVLFNKLSTDPLFRGYRIRLFIRYLENILKSLYFRLNGPKN